MDPSELKRQVDEAIRLLLDLDPETGNRVEKKENVTNTTLNTPILDEGSQNWINYPSYNLSPSDLVAGLNRQNEDLVSITNSYSTSLNCEQPLALSSYASTSAQNYLEDLTRTYSQPSFISDLPLDLSVRKRFREENHSVTSESKRNKSACGKYYLE